jgi:hypothetical protein
MRSLLDFSKDLKEFVEEEKTDKELQRLKQEFPVDYCLKQIKTESYLWDMRTWKKYKDKEEILAWLDTDTRHDSKNCGHTALCIYTLIHAHKIPKEKVMGAILENNNVKFKDTRNGRVIK